MHQVGRGAVGAHPDHVARIQSAVLADFRNVSFDVVNHRTGLEAVDFLAVQPHRGGHVPVIGATHDPRAHWIERVGIFCAPAGAVAALPRAFAYVVADRPAKHVIERFILRNFSTLFSDDRDELAFILKEFAGVLRLDDGITVSAQRVVGAVIDVGALGEFRLDAAPLCRGENVLAIVEAHAIKRRRDHRYEQLDL